MKRLLEMKGGEVVQNGKSKGTRYRDLDEASVNRLAKKSLGEPELGKYCRTLLALIEYESDERGKADTSMPKEDGTATATAAVPAGELALVPVEPVLKRKRAEEIVVKSTPGIKQHLQDLGHCVGSWTWPKKLAVLLAVLAGIFIVLTSPIIADRAGEAVAAGINLTFMRLGEFLYAFQRSLLINLGVYYPRAEEYRFMNSNKPVYHEAEPVRDRIETRANYNPWHELMHELGSATFGALSAVSVGIAYFANSAVAAAAN
jgi:hypothetical protein